ncbi:MAG: multidrug transporter [Spiroplasma poulsonii]|uniref:Multidrug export protein MepA n=1 Tax=Spiroplasma poulsonii TaxID=2138 RepID=A0A2P6FBU5_9MOLU|nr:MATE family efflux transporter [Spiroplasma poulsonii]KAF0851345.1 Multidrug export protein MepA [Spiroplasma poulsonii]MBW1241687.1 multidrug transporter [Spiroplasma poulsonii]PQM30938.1 Multidrug export protein MepA [Spiroplasma poulsonii]PWF95932.1 Multidrug export protein MepA [Spiroplasma poulsonii]PWF98708.1 Multidrug export protein MepA [Spiroplasma poulsonii]
MHKSVFSKTEIKLRYDNLWKIIFVFSLPTVFVMAISASYPILDKLIALTFVTPNVYHYQPYLDWYRENINNNNGVLSYQVAKIFVNLATHFSGQIYNLLLAFAVLIAIGTSITFTIKYGQNNKQQTQSLAGNALTITILFSIVAAFFVFCLVFPKWDNIMIFIQLSKKGSWITKDLTWRYVFPMLLASPLMFISYLLLTLLRTDGKGRIVVYIMVGSILVNVCFSIILVKYANLLLEGTMFGTIISWVFIIVVSLICIYRNKDSYLRFHWKDLFYFRKSTVKEIFRLGFSSFLNNLGIVLVSILSSTIMSYLPGQFDEKQRSGLSAFQLFNSAMTPWVVFFTAIALGFAQGIKSIIGYNYGAKKYLRMYQTCWYGLIIIGSWLFFVLLLFIGLGPQLLMTFAFPSSLVDQYRWTSVLMLMSYPCAAISFMGVTLFQGMNNARKAALCSSFRTLIVLPVLMLAGAFIVRGLSDGTPKNNIYYFIMIGFNDLISGIIVGIILYSFWYKHRHSIFNEVSKMDQEYLRIKTRHNKNKIQ